MLDYNPTGDGILTSLMLIQILLEKNLSASKLCENFNKFPQVLINVKVKNEKKSVYLEDEEIQNTIKEIENELNGNGRVVIRASGTEPLIRVMLEGQNQKGIEEKATKLANLIKIKLN